MLFQLLPRQTTPYTCGAACLASIARLCNLPWTEKEIALACNAQPKKGIENDILRCWAEKHLPVSKKPCFPSIWNIRNPLSNNGHYVLVLGEGDGTIRYYDPLYARTLEYPVSQVDWQSGCGQYKKWRLDFHVPGNWYDQNFLGDAHEGTPAGEPIPEFVLNSVKKYLDRYTPTSPKQMCPLGGTCTCSITEKCASR